MEEAVCAPADPCPLLAACPQGTASSTLACTAESDTKYTTSWSLCAAPRCKSCPCLQRMIELQPFLVRLHHLLVCADPLASPHLCTCLLPAHSGKLKLHEDIAAGGQEKGNFLHHERRAAKRRFKRSFQLPDTAQGESAVASLSKGVLKVHVQKIEPPPKPEPKRIAVQMV